MELKPRSGMGSRGEPLAGVWGLAPTRSLVQSEAFRSTKRAGTRVLFHGNILDFKYNLTSPFFCFSTNAIPTTLSLIVGIIS